MAWTVDTVHTEVGFAVKHMTIATIRGRFMEIDVDLQLDEEHPEQSHVAARIQAASILTSNPAREDALRGEDFLAVDEYPTMTFSSREVSYDGNGRLRVAGGLTVRTATSPLVLEGEVGGPVEDPWGNQRAGVSLRGALDRQPFGMPWSQLMPAGAPSVGMEVELYVDAQLVQQPDTPA
jgi:polyisoprenoid-binding protein YceI